MRGYSAKSLIAAYQWARNNPNGVIKIDSFETMTSEEWINWFKRCLNEKASRGLNCTGRKWSYDWFSQARRVAREVNTPRLIVRWIPAEFRGRLAHRVYTD